MFSAVSFSQCGGLAQLGERLAGSQKVRGSSPLSSTLLCGTRSHRAADPSKTGVFFCAGKSVCDSLQPLAGTCCVVFCVTFRRWFSPMSLVDSASPAARSICGRQDTHQPLLMCSYFRDPTTGPPGKENGGNACF